MKEEYFGGISAVFRRYFGGWIRRFLGGCAHKLYLLSLPRRYEMKFCCDAVMLAVECKYPSSINAHKCLFIWVMCVDRVWRTPVLHTLSSPQKSSIILFEEREVKDDEGENPNVPDKEKMNE